MIRHLKVFVLCFLILLLAMPAAFASNGFNDVPEDYTFYEEINAIAAAGITVGDGQGNFLPTEDVRRGQMAAFIARALELDVDNPPDTSSFNDVSVDDTFFKYIEAIADKDITVGDGQGNFLPLENVRRGQMAAFMARALELDVDNPPNTSSFNDVSVDYTFFKYIEAIAAEGITVGDGKGNFLPTENIRRGQMAAFIARAFGLLVEECTVTFEEANELEGVSIKIYKDSSLVEELQTGSDGKASFNPLDGVYSYTAMLAGYYDVSGDFSVDGVDKNISFEMENGQITKLQAKVVHSGIITFDEQPKEGSLLILISGNRQGGAPKPPTPSGWTERSHEPGTPGASKNLVLFSKIAGPNEPTSVDVMEGGSQFLIFQEFHGAEIYNFSGSNNATTGNSVGLTSLGIDLSVGSNTLAIAGLLGRYDAGTVAFDYLNNDENLDFLRGYNSSTSLTHATNWTDSGNIPGTTAYWATATDSGASGSGDVQVSALIVAFDLVYGDKP